MKYAVLVSTVLLAAFGAQAQEATVPTAARQSLGLTVYNNGTTLVTDRRQVILQQGENRLAFEGVSSGINPASATLVPAGEGPDFQVRQQSYDFTGIELPLILRKLQGQEITWVRENGNKAPARIISSQGGNLVLEIDGEIELNPPGYPVIESLPQGLRSEPALVAQLVAEEAGERLVDLAYLSGGLDWQANYVAELPEEGPLSLKAWIGVTNNSETDFSNAQAQFVAGDVRSVDQMRSPAPMAMEMSAKADAGPSRESLGGAYHIYRLADPVTIGAQESRQFALFSAPEVEIERQFLFEGERYYFENQMGEPLQDNALIVLRLTNNKESGLGQPLPAGIVRVYSRQNGALYFMGSDRLDHTAAGEDVRLTLGSAFDITSTKRQTAFERLGEGAYESAYEVVLRNARDVPATVTVREGLFGDWQIIDSSHKHSKPDANTAQWQIELPANGQETLTFRVRVRS